MSDDGVVTLLSILAAHAIAVPLSPTFPAHELRYIIDQSESLMLLSSEKFQSQADDVLKEGMETKPINYKQEKIMMGKTDDYVTLEEPTSEKGGMMLYTSGTTNRPKGVLLPQDVLTAQSRSLLEAWNYGKDDVLLHVLPLHHIHGTVNALLTPLFAGSRIEFQFPFNATAVWERLAAPFLPNPDPAKKPITFLTVVPTIYTRLLSSHASLSPELQAATKAALHPSNMRLNISGSAALPTPVKSAWTELSGGNVLLERYGMTEVGMALSCGLSFNDRVDGSVGWPLPSVQARLVDTETGALISETDESRRNPAPRPHHLPRILEERRSHIEGIRRRPRRQRQMVQDRRRRRAPRRFGNRSKRPVLGQRAPVLHPRPQIRRHYQNRWREGFCPRDRARNAVAPTSRRSRRRRPPV
jgi:malonyl-CoA/methylmalonyl-CoA synthetase